MATEALDLSGTVLDARARYFTDNGFGDDGGYSARWVTVKLGPVQLPLLNTAARVRAVARHDLHHIATGYATDLVGEAEIAAWEIAAGCGGFAAAWVLNLWAISLGIWLSPGRIFRAFVRGRRNRTLYHAPGEIDPGLLRGSVAGLRARLGTDAALADATTADRLSFTFWIAVAVILGIATLAVALAPLAALVALLR